MVGRFDNSGTSARASAPSHPELDKFASANLVPRDARDCPRSAGNNPSGLATYYPPLTTTTFPLARPVSTYLIASGTSLILYVRSITDLIFPSASMSR